MFKIAIQGHPTRGKEVIQILESLGGKNKYKLKGISKIFYYINNKNEISEDHKDNFPLIYKFYTLEEFEKEFPFKIGDKVITTLNHIGTITGIVNNKYNVLFKKDSALISPYRLKSYEKMKEERNITLTLNKAKEWYKKGGELKEVALQAYSEEELTKFELPKTWEEFCENYPIKKGEAYIDDLSNIQIVLEPEDRTSDTICYNICPSQKSAQAHLALMQLEQLRDCYRQGDIPDFTKNNPKYCIHKVKEEFKIIQSISLNHFISFNVNKVAEEYLKNFEYLLNIAGDLI